MSGATEEKEEKSPFFQMYKNTCLKIESAADKIRSSVEASSAPTPSNPVPTMADAMRLVKECGVHEKTSLMHTAVMLIMKAEFRQILNLHDTNEGRYDLIEREHEKEMKKPACRQLNYYLL
jgi:formate-dependent nitrite reductase cytochrome c552 subunit